MRRRCQVSVASVLWAMTLAAWAADPSPVMDEADAVSLLGGAATSSTARVAPSGRQTGLPVLSIFINYVPETGELTPSALDKLRPLYRVISASELSPLRFEVVCCAMLPPPSEAALRLTLSTQLRRWFERDVPNPPIHVQFRASDAAPSPLPSVHFDPNSHMARIDVYRVE